MTSFFAERVRFELTELLHSVVFKTTALNHYATSPCDAALGFEPRLLESKSSVLNHYTIRQFKNEIREFLDGVFLSQKLKV